MSFLNEVFSEWAVLAAKAREGKPVKKKEVIRLLENDAPIPEIAKPMLKGLFTGDYKFQRGETSELESMKSSACLRFVAIHSALAETTVENMLRNKTRLQGDPTSALVAKELVSGQFGIEVRTLEKWLREFNEQ